MLVPIPSTTALIATTLLLTAAKTDARGGLRVGDVAPAFALKALASAPRKTFSLADYVGPKAIDAKKVVLIAFDGVPCSTRPVTDFFSALVHEYRNQGLLVLDIDPFVQDDGARRAEVAARVAGFDFPVLHDRFGSVAGLYGYVPKTSVVYLIDANQKIAKAWDGYEPKAYPEMLKAIRGLLGIADSEPIPAALQAFMKLGCDLE
jgi:peroxiredoxin